MGFKYFQVGERVQTVYNGKVYYGTIERVADFIDALVRLDTGAVSWFSMKDLDVADEKKVTS